MGEEEKEKAVWPLQATVGSACRLNVMRLQERRKNPMGERDRGGEDSVPGLSVALCGDGERLPAATKSSQLWE